MFKANLLNLRHSGRRKHRSKEKKVFPILFCSPVFSLCKSHIEGFYLRREGWFILKKRTLLHLLANICWQLPLRKPSVKSPKQAFNSHKLVTSKKVPSVNTIDVNAFTAQSSGTFFSLFVWLVMLQRRNRDLAIIWISFHNIYIAARIVTTKKSIRNSWPVELDCSTDNIYHELFAKSYEIS